MGRKACAGVAAQMLAAALLASPAMGQGPVSLSVSGGPGEIALAPGGEGQTSFTVRNPASYRQRVEIDVTGLAVGGGSYQFEGKPPAGMTVRVLPDRFTIPAGRGRDVLVAVRVVSSFSPGGAYAGLLVRGVPEAREGAPVIGEIGIPLLVRVAGEASDEGRIVSFRAERAVYRSGPIKFLIAFENTGGVHYPIRGGIEIFHRGASLGSIDVAPALVLPKTTKTLNATWAGTPPVGTLGARLTLTWGTDGRHQDTREAILRVAGAAPPPTKEGGQPPLWLVPLTALFIVGVVLLFLLWPRRKKEEEEEKRSEFPPVSRTGRAIQEQPVRIPLARTQTGSTRRRPARHQGPRK